MSIWKLFVGLTKGSFGLVAILFLLLVTGALNPIQVWFEEKHLKKDGPIWASQVTGLNLPADAMVLKAEAVAMGMQGDGSNELILQFNDAQAQHVLTQIQQSPRWSADLSTCVQIDAARCVDPQPNCYRLSEAPRRDEALAGKFCRNSQQFALQVSWW